MNIQIQKYNPPKDYEQLLALMQSEGEEWEEYLDPKYQVNLAQSITYVAYCDEVLCGYSRSMSDFGYFVWVIDLLVDKQYRGHSIGQQLLEGIQLDFPDQKVFVMSDVDAYYEKLGYTKEGSIFKVKMARRDSKNG